MNVKRLTILRDALIQFAADQGNLKFDLATFAALPEKYQGERNWLKVVLAAKRAKNFCGTTACACGLAATIPAFRRAGLRMSTPPADDTADGAGLKFAGLGGWSAIGAFFDIDWCDANELFHENCYENEDRKNPLAVADKITALLHTV